VLINQIAAVSSKYRIISILSLLLCALITGCSTTVLYPSAWSPLVTEPGCKSISGTYLNRGEAAGKYSTFLSDWLVRSGSQEKNRLSSYQQLSIILDHKNQIVISGLNEDGSSDQLVNIENHECREGSISFNFSGVHNGDNVASLESSWRHLHKSGDYLVVESTSSGVGIVLLIPVVGSANNWARFLSVEHKQ
jgi:hypothetical protein